MDHKERQVGLDTSDCQKNSASPEQPGRRIRFLSDPPPIKLLEQRLADWWSELAREKKQHQ